MNDSEEAKLRRKQEAEEFGASLQKIQELKQKLLKTGKRKRKGKATCPSCGAKNTFKLVLAGRKNHLHAKCVSDTCGLWYME